MEWSAQDGLSNHHSGAGRVAGPVFMRANWGLIPRRTTDPKKLPLLINARCETVATNGYFKFPYANSRALMPIDGFFEWKDIYGTGKDKQPYAIAMADGSPFCLAAIWESWRNPETGEDFRTFAILTCEPNEVMATIHDRTPVILQRADYQRWLDPEEKDPRDLLKPIPVRADEDVADRPPGGQLSKQHARHSE